MQTNVTTKQSICIVLCPCKYLNAPDLATSDCCLCCHESPKSDLLTIPPYIEIAGTCLKPSNPVNKAFIIYRLIAMIYTIFVAAFSFYLYAKNGDAIYFFIYFTQWVALISVLLNILRFISTVKIYGDVKQFAAVHEIDTDTGLWKLYKFHKIVLQITLPCVSMLVANYWLFVYDGSFNDKYWMISSLQLHGTLCIVLWFDFLISAEKMYYKSPIWSIMFGTIFTVWSVIFEIFINMNDEGDEYIYSTYDWSESITTPLMYYCLSLVLLSIFSTLLTFIKNIILICSTIGGSKYEMDEGSESDDGAESEVPLNV